MHFEILEAKLACTIYEILTSFWAAVCENNCDIRPHEFFSSALWKRFDAALMQVLGALDAKPILQYLYARASSANVIIDHYDREFCEQSVSYRLEFKSVSFA
jgi:hypothetical protein